MDNSGEKIELSLFTKFLKGASVLEIGNFTSGLGFDGIELPLRPGFQVEPENAEKSLPLLARQLGDFGLKIFSVASTPEEKIFTACAEADIPIIRIMVPIGDEGYLASEKKTRDWLEKLLPLCEKYGVKVGIQNHCDRFVSNSMEIRHLIEALDPELIGAVWDAGHSGLAGEEPELGLDIVWSHLCMVNLKNAFYKRISGLESEEAEWERRFTTGRQGLSSWKRIIRFLDKRDYKGVICLHAEYTDEGNTEAYIRQDIEYVKSLVNIWRGGLL